MGRGGGNSRPGYFHHLLPIKGVKQTISNSDRELKYRENASLSRFSVLGAVYTETRKTPRHAKPTLTPSVQFRLRCTENCKKSL